MEFLASTVGSGIVGSMVFTWLRQCFPPPSTMPAEPLRTVYWLLWSRQGARITSMALAALCMMIAASVIAVAQGEPLGSAILASFDAALAASGISQLVHTPQLSAVIALANTPEPPKPEPTSDMPTGQESPNV